MFHFPILTITGDGLALALLLLVCPIVMVCYFSTLDGGDPSTDTATVLEQLHVQLSNLIERREEMLDELRRAMAWE
jgi:hypothetical protein